MVLSAVTTNSWTEKKANKWVLEKIPYQEKLLVTLNRRKMSFLGHVLRSNDISHELSMGTAHGKRGRGRPKVRYSENIKKLLVVKVLYTCPVWLRIELNGEPRGGLF